MKMENIVQGKAFVFGKNIDTDQIYPGRFVEYTEINDIKKYAMYGADESFTTKFNPQPVPQYGQIVGTYSIFGTFFATIL